MSAAAARRRRAAEPPGALAASPYLATMLSRLGRVRVAYDFDFTDEEAADNPSTPDCAYLEQTELRERGFTGRIGIPVSPASQPAVVVLDPEGRPRAALVEEARQHDVVGYVRLVEADWTPAQHDQLATAIERAAERLITDLVFRLGELRRNEDLSRVRVEEILLGYASRHLVLSANPIGVVVPWVARPAAQAILDLPLFPTADGYAVSAWRLVNEFCAFGVAAYDDPERQTALRQALSGELPAHLLAWVRANLLEGRVIRLASADSRRVVPRAALLGSGRTAPGALPRTLTYWLEHLRPDNYAGEGAGQTHVDVVMGHELFEPETFASSFGFTGSHVRWRRLNELSRPDSSSSLRARGEFAIYDVDRSRLYLNRHHWLVEEAIASDCDAEWVAWLLLACYAFINEILEPVTNEHEQLFQLRVAEALDREELKAVT